MRKRRSEVILLSVMMALECCMSVPADVGIPALQEDAAENDWSGQIAYEAVRMGQPGGEETDEPAGGIIMDESDSSGNLLEDGAEDGLTLDDGISPAAEDGLTLDGISPVTAEEETESEAEPGQESGRPARTAAGDQTEYAEKSRTDPETEDQSDAPEIIEPESADEAEIESEGPAEDETEAISMVEGAEMETEALDAALAGESVPIDEAHFPDEVLRKYVSDNFDKADADGNKDGVLSADEINDATYIYYPEEQSQSATSLEGIRYLPNLTSITLMSGWYSSKTGNITRLDLSHNRKLQSVSCNYQKLTEVTIGDLPELTTFDVEHNALTELDLTGCPKLSWLYCDDNSLTSQSLRMNTDVLARFNCSNNPMGSLDLSRMPDLKELSCNNTGITELDAAKIPNVIWLYCDDNSLTSLDLTQCSKLQQLSCDNNSIPSLDLSRCGHLFRVDCSDNALTQLQMPDESLSLKYFTCSSNALPTLHMGNVPKLLQLECMENELTSLTGTWPSMTTLDCNDNQLTSIDVSGCPDLETLRCGLNHIFHVNIGEAGGTKISNLNLSPQTAYVDEIQNGSEYSLDLNQVTDDVSGFVLSSLDPSNAKGTLENGMIRADRSFMEADLRRNLSIAGSEHTVLYKVYAARIIDASSGADGVISDDNTDVSVQADTGSSGAESLFTLPGGGFERVVWAYGGNGTDPALLVERYDAGMNYLSGKKISLDYIRTSADTPNSEIVWGGVYEGESYNFIVTGRPNAGEDNSRVTVRVSKFSKEWKFIGSCNISANNEQNGVGGVSAYYPFDVAPVRFAEQDGKLWVVSSRSGYASRDGLHHTGRIALIINEKNMKLEGTAGDYYHSFSSFLVSSNGSVFSLELSERARSVFIEKMDKSKFTGDSSANWQAGTVDAKEIYPFWHKSEPGIWSYYLNGNIGGLAACDSRKTLLAVGTGQDTGKVQAAEDAGNSNSVNAIAWNVWLRVVDQDGLGVRKAVNLTNYPDGSGIRASSSEITKVSDDRFLVTWAVTDQSTGDFYRECVYLDGEGNVLTDTFRLDGGDILGTPVVSSDGTVIWYTAGSNRKPVFTTVSGSDFNNGSHAVYLTLDANGGTVDGLAQKTFTYTYPSAVAWVLPTPAAPADGDQYEFQGWYTDKNGKNKFDGSPVPYYKKRLYASWKDLTNPWKSTGSTESGGQDSDDDSESDDDEDPTVKLNASYIPLKTGQETKVIKASGMLEGDFVWSCKTSNKKIVTAKPYRSSGVQIKAGRKTGTAKVTVYTAYGASVTLKVKVQKKKVRTSKISVSSGKKIVLKKKKSFQIKAAVTPLTSVDKITYSSKNKKIAKVSKSGRIEAGRKKGRTTITVKSGRKKIKIAVIVS